MASVATLLALLIWFISPRLGGEWFQRLTHRIYDTDGDVVPSISANQHVPKWPPYVLAGAFLVGVPISVLLTHLGYLPYGYLQPVSALYVVPILIAIFASMRSHLSLFFLLWPILYCIHAVLIVSGVPITFVGPCRTLNLLIPTVGYGALTGVVEFLAAQLPRDAIRDVKQ
ncbi:MAG: hypothetical protein OXN89_16355 [Bryobacterales bacterium]|nr:hypothetical protein [Bryobacterales bacterium]